MAIDRGTPGNTEAGDPSEPVVSSAFGDIVAKFAKDLLGPEGMASPRAQHLAALIAGSRLTEPGGPSVKESLFTTAAQSDRGETVGAMIDGLEVPGGEGMAARRNSAQAHLDRVRARIARKGVRLPETILGEVRLASIIRDNHVTNIRTAGDEAKYLALRESIRTYGVVEPIILVQDSLDREKARPVSGRRRLRAAAEIGLTSIPAVVFPAATEERILHAMCAIENLQRENLSSFEVVEYARLMQSRFRVSTREFADMIGRSERTVDELVLARERLDFVPSIVEDWSHSHPLLTNERILRASRMLGADPIAGPAAVADWWDRVKRKYSPGPREPDLVDEEDADVGEQRREQRLSPRQMEHLRREIRMHPGMSKEERRAVVIVIDYALGRRDSAFGVVVGKRRGPYRRKREPDDRDERELTLPDFSGPP